MGKEVVRDYCRRRGARDHRPLAASIIVAALLFQLLVARPAAADRGSPVPHQPLPARPGPVPNHPYFLLDAPQGSENWTAGQQASIIWHWVHDPDPVHRIDLYLSIVGCEGDTDLIFYPIVKGLKSDKKNGDSEQYAFTLDPTTPTTDQGCVRMCYTSPVAPGCVSSDDEFRITNPSEPLAKIDVEVGPPGNQVPSGQKGTISVRASVRGYPLWLTNSSVTVSAGKLAKPWCVSLLNGICTLSYEAPKVGNETSVDVLVNATHQWFTTGSGKGDLTVVPPTAKRLFVQVAVTPTPAFGATPTSVVVSVRNVTMELEGAIVAFASEGAFKPPTGRTNETGGFEATWTPPEIAGPRIIPVKITTVYPDHPSSTTEVDVQVVPRPIPKQYVSAWLDAPGVLETGSVAMHVQVTDQKCTLRGAFVNVVDSGGAVLEPNSSGETDHAGRFSAVVHPPPANGQTRTIAIKINVTEAKHAPVETQLFLDVYPGQVTEQVQMLRTGGLFFGVLGGLLAAALALAGAGLMIGRSSRRRPAPEPEEKKLEADGGEDRGAEPGTPPSTGEKTGEKSADEKKDDGAPRVKAGETKEDGKRRRVPVAAGAGGAAGGLANMLFALAIVLALVAIIISTPLGQDPLLEKGTSEETIPAPEPQTQLGDLAFISTCTGLAVVEVARLRIVSMLPTGLGGHDVDYDPAKGLVYVSHMVDGTVSAVDARDLRIVSTMSVGRSPRHIAAEPGGSRLWSVNDGDPSVSVLDTAKMIETARIPLPTYGGHGDIELVTSGASTVAYVSHSSGWLFQVSETKVEKKWFVGAGIHEMAVAGSALFIGSTSGKNVTMFDLQSQSPGAATPLASNVSFVSLAPDATSVLVGLVDSSAFGLLDPATGALVSSHATVSVPVSVTYTPDRKYAYFASGTDPEVVVNRLDNGSIEDRMVVGKPDPKLLHQRALAADLTDDIYVTSSADGTAQWIFHPHINFHPVHGGATVGAQPIDVVIV